MATADDAATLAVQLTLYSRAYCHLCDEMIAGLQPLQAALSRSTLESSTSTPTRRSSGRYGDGRAGARRTATRELCRYRLDAARGRDCLAAVALETDDVTGC